MARWPCEVRCLTLAIEGSHACRPIARAGEGRKELRKSRAREEPANTARPLPVLLTPLRRTPLIDTHCHLDMPDFDADREHVWQRARQAGVQAAIVPGTDPERWSHTRALARPGERYVAIGIHPQVLPDLAPHITTQALADLERVARESGAVAIGECGLDGKIDLSRASLERQCQVFAAHIEIARALDLPLIVHVFHAHGEALSLLRSMALPRAGGVIHSYSGSAELVREYISLGFYLSFAGAITRPSARRPVMAARVVPRERLLLETDAPDQFPTGAPPSGPTGRRCEPGHLPWILARLADVRGEDPAVLAAATTANAKALFRLPDKLSGA